MVWVGANAEIRSFRPAVPTVQRSLLDPSLDHAPTIARLLSTPWVRRGSELLGDKQPPSTGGASSRLAHRTDEQVVIEADPTTGFPAKVTRRAGRAYRVVRIVERWVDDRNWHRPELHVSEHHYRVAAVRTGGVRHAATFELVHDLVKEEWRLTGIHD